jgi:hypothetical protein
MLLGWRLFEIEGDFKQSGFTLESCDYNRISKQFSDLISTDMLERDTSGFKTE